MAGNDVYLWSVPSDSNANDPRLRDPTTTGGAASYSLIATSSAITLAGSNVVLAVGRKLAASTSAIALTASNTGLQFGHKINATSSAITLAGSTVALATARKLTATSSAVSLAGSNVVLGTGRKLEATSSGIVLTGSEVTLTYTSAAVAYELTVESSAIVLHGSTVSFEIGTTASSTSAGTYNMYRGPDEPRRKRKLRKIKYIGPSEKVQTFYIEATKVNEWIPSIIRRPSVLETIERNGLKTRQWKGTKLRRQIMADDEWLMMA